MKFVASDLRSLRASLAILLLMLALGVAAAAYARGRVVEAKTALAAAQAERNEIGGKLRQVKSEEGEIRQKAAVFDRLAARGVIGEEERLEWVELLNEIRDRRRLPEVQYEFAPQRALERAGAGASGLYASAMKLQAQLLHEEDLVRLLGDLRERAPALIQVKRCDLSRLSAADTGKPRQGSLRADCLIDWITLRLAGSGAEHVK